MGLNTNDNCTIELISGPRCEPYEVGETFHWQIVAYAPEVDPSLSGDYVDSYQLLLDINPPDLQMFPQIDVTITSASGSDSYTITAPITSVNLSTLLLVPGERFTIDLEATYSSVPYCKTSYTPAVLIRFLVTGDDGSSWACETCQIQGDSIVAGINGSLEIDPTLGDCQTHFLGSVLENEVYASRIIDRLNRREPSWPPALP